MEELAIPHTLPLGLRARYEVWETKAEGNRDFYHGRMFLWQNAGRHDAGEVAESSMSQSGGESNVTDMVRWKAHCLLLETQIKYINTAFPFIISHPFDFFLHVEYLKSFYILGFHVASDDAEVVVL